MTKELFIKSIDRARQQYGIDMRNSRRFEDSYNNHLLYSALVDVLTFNVTFFNKKEAIELVTDYIFHNNNESSESIYDKIHFCININKGK